MTYTSEVLADSPWGFWEFNSIAASTALNQPGPFAGEASIAFSGADSATTAATHSVNVSTQEAWVYLDSYPNADTAVFSMWAADNSHDRDMWIDTAGKVHWYYYPGYPVFLVAPTALTLNTWHHIVASVGPAGGKLRIDKLTVATDAATTGWTGQPQKVSLHLSSLTANGGSAGVGAMRIAAHAVYLTQLTDVRTDAHYDASTTYASEVMADSPWGFWEFTETSGLALADSSGAARTMTLTTPGLVIADSSGAARIMMITGVNPSINQTGPFASAPAIAWASGGDGSAATTADHSVTVSTQETWLYLTEYPSVNTAVCSMFADNVSHDRDMWIDPSGNVNWYFWPSYVVNIASSAALTLNAWHHIVASVGPAGAKVRIDKITVATHAATNGWGGTQKVGLHLTTLNNGGGGGGASGTGAMMLAAHAVYLTQLSDARTDAHYDAGMVAGTPTTTGTSPVSIATSSAVSFATTTSGTAPINVGTSNRVQFVTVPTTTGDAPIAVGSSSRVILVVVTTGTTPISVGSSSHLPVVAYVTTGLAPISIGTTSRDTTSSVTTGVAPISIHTLSMGFIVGAPTTGLAAVGVATTSAVSGVFTATGLSRVTIGTSSAASSTITLVGWTADTSQRSLLDIVSGTGELDYTPPVVAGIGTDYLPPVGTLVLPPATLTERTIRRYSVSVPAMTPTSGRVRVNDAVYDAYSTVIEDVGVPHLLVSGHDVTYFRGTPTTLNMDRQENPFGDSRFSFDLPQLTPFEGSGEGSLTWLYPGAEVEVVMVLAGVMTRLWAGHLISDDGGNDATTPRTTWSAEGTMYQASWFSHRVPTIMDPTDIGKAIAGSLNGVVSRRYSKLYAPTTTILTRDRGTTADSELSYVQRLLSTSWTAAGLQWTISKVAPWAALYALVLKNRTTVNHTVTVGGRGVEVDLSRDLTATSNCIFGRGIGPDGYGWAGWVYPNLTADTAPAYPYSSGATVMNVGSTDAGTVSGSGVTDWQRRINDLNLTGNVPLDGVYNTSDAAVCRVIQRDYGLTVDGVVGPQTWAATFAVGSGSGDLSGAYRRPLAIDPKVEPYLYSASGAITGPNPAYDAKVIRIERDIDYGPGVTKAEATASAVLELARDKDPCLTGRIVLTEGGDPREGSRFLMKPGENVKALGYGGHDVIVQAAAVERDWVNLKVTLEVDEHARDAMTLASIRDRNKAARVDPARRPGPVNRRSRLTQDVVVDFDGESSAGVIPRMALYSGLWSVIHIPISQVGRIASVKVNTTGPKATFCLALFGAPVTPAHLVSLVGNPLVGADPFARTETKADALDNLGFIEAYGNESKPAGYWPATTTTTITGRLVETAPTEYVSEKPPWVWVAIWSPTSCFIEGRLRPAPIQ